MPKPKKAAAKAAPAAPAPQGDSRQPEFRGMPAKTKSQLRAEEWLEARWDTRRKADVAKQREAELRSQMLADKLVTVVGLSAVGEKYRFDLQQGQAKIKIKKL